MKGSSIDDLKAGMKVVQETERVLRGPIETDEEILAVVAGCAKTFDTIIPLYIAMQRHVQCVDASHEYVETAKAFLKSYDSCTKALASVVEKLKKQ